MPSKAKQTAGRTGGSGAPNGAGAHGGRAIGREAQPAGGRAAATRRPRAPIATRAWTPQREGPQGAREARRDGQEQGLPHLRRGERRAPGRRRARSARRRRRRPRRRGHRDRRRRDAGEDRAEAHRRRGGGREEARRRRRDREEEDVDYYSKSNDPVRMYLRKMGSVSLLTREGEVEIAKRIETASSGATPPSSTRPSPCARSSTSARSSGSTRSASRSIISDAESDDQEFDEEEADRRIIRLIDKVKHLDKKKLDLLEERKEARATVAQEGRSRPRSTRDRQRAGRDARGDAPQQEDDRQIVQKLKGLISKVERAEAGATELERRTGPRQGRARSASSPRSRATASPRRASPRSSTSRATSSIDFESTIKNAQKGLKKVEEELQLDVKAIRADVREHPRGRAHGRARQGRARRGEPPPRRLASRRSTRTAACSSST